MWKDMIERRRTSRITSNTFILRFMLSEGTHHTSSRAYQGAKRDEISTLCSNINLQIEQHFPKISLLPCRPPPCWADGEP